MSKYSPESSKIHTPSNIKKNIRVAFPKHFRPGAAYSNNSHSSNYTPPPPMLFINCAYKMCDLIQRICYNYVTLQSRMHRISPIIFFCLGSMPPYT